MGVFGGKAHQAARTTSVKVPTVPRRLKTERGGRRSHGVGCDGSRRGRGHWRPA